MASVWVGTVCLWTDALGCEPHGVGGHLWVPLPHAWLNVRSSLRQRTLSTSQAPPIPVDQLRLAVLCLTVSRRHVWNFLKWCSDPTLGLAAIAFFSIIKYLVILMKIKYQMVKFCILFTSDLELASSGG